jgi:Mg2+-importing ATPase
MDRATAARLCGHDVLAQLGGSELGLSQAEAAKRRLQYGPNVLKKERITALRILGRQFQSALIYFLMVAAVLAFFTGDMSDSIIITIILLLNTALGFSQEYRSERAVERLSRLISDKVLVKRDGRAMLVEVVDLVPGDIVVLKEGDVVPADIKLLTADNVAVDESQLTGESVPVSKTAEVDTASDGDASLIFAGSTVVRGELTGVVYATANETALGRIAVLSTSIRKVTQYEKSLRAFSALLLKITIVTLTATLLLKISLNGIAHFPQLLLFVIALAVAVVPEALPVIATLTLARGALRMASEKVVVKRLSSLEDLGNITILCTDKTGTLTENRLTIQHVDASDQHLFEILAYATIDQAALGTRGTQSSFDAAFDMYISPDIKQQARTFTILKEIPFDPAARRRRVLLADQTTGSHYLVVIGAPETLLDLTHPASEQHYRAKIAVEGQQGLRHLALAYKQLTATDTTDILELEKDCIFLGFVTLTDPLRASTPQTIATAKQLGVAIKILSGDSCEVVAYVARQVG